VNGRFRREATFMRNGPSRQRTVQARKCSDPMAVAAAWIISQRFETFRRTARTLRIAAKPKHSILNKASHVDRLSDQIRELREKARGLPAGDERAELLRKAEQDEIALRLIEWITSSGQLPPPEDLIPIRRHRLRRE